MLSSTNYIFQYKFCFVFRTTDCCDGCCCGIDVWAIVLNVILQDAPFLTLRMLIIFQYKILNYMSVFFTCKYTEWVSLFISICRNEYSHYLLLGSLHSVGLLTGRSPSIWSFECSGGIPLPLLLPKGSAANTFKVEVLKLLKRFNEWYSSYYFLQHYIKEVTSARVTLY